jgi:DNA-binding MarR family transcriptional regulator
MFIPDEFFRTTEFINFSKSREYILYFFLRAYIIRESRLFNDPYYHPAYGLYKKFFMNGMLVARYPQKTLAKLLNTDVRCIIRRLNNLEKKGFIKRIKTRYGKKTITHYQLGEWFGEVGNEENYTETYYLDSYFEKVSKEELQQRKDLQGGHGDHLETGFEGGHGDHP